MSKKTVMLNENKNYTSEDSSLLSIYMKEINRIPLLTREQEYTYSVRANKGDSFARKKLIESNLRFVVNIAKKYQNQGLPLADLIDEGNIGLMTAIEKFDPDKGYHFISYAVWWIRQSVMKAINEKGRAVRLPLNRSNELFQIQKAAKALTHENGEDPTHEMIAERTNLDVSVVDRLLKISQDLVSLDSPVYRDESESSIGDFIPSTGMLPDQTVMESALTDDVNQALSELSEKEKSILEYRFGLNGKSPMSLKEVGEIYNLTKERIRQIEKRALSKLKDTETHKSLEAYSA